MVEGEAALEPPGVTTSPRASPTLPCRELVAPQKVTSALSGTREGAPENMLGEEEQCAARSRSDRTGEGVVKSAAARESSVFCSRGCWRGGAHLKHLCCHAEMARKASPSTPAAAPPLTFPAARAMLEKVRAEQEEMRRLREECDSLARNAKQRVEETREWLKQKARRSNLPSLPQCAALSPTEQPRNEEMRSTAEAAATPGREENHRHGKGDLVETPL